MISDLSWATSSNREDQPYEEWNTKTIHPTELLTFLPSTLVTIQWSHWALLDFFLDGASGSTMAKKCFLVDLNISVKNITYQWCKICPFLPPKTVNWEVPMCHSKQVCLQEPESDAKDTQPLHVIKHQTIFQIQLMIIGSQKYYLMPKGPRLIIISPSLKTNLTNYNRTPPEAYAWEPLSWDLREWRPFEKIFLTSLPQLLSLWAPFRCTSVLRIQR